MNKITYPNLSDVCSYLEKHYCSYFETLGVERDKYGNQTRQHTEEGFLMPPLKPHFLFRGQYKAYETLRPSIYRNYSAMSTFREYEVWTHENEKLVCPNPFYSVELARDYHFSCVKAAELTLEIQKRFPKSSYNVNGHALCQHYGLRTHFLDFTENVLIAAFFASHEFRDGNIIPCSEGIGVIYIMQTSLRPNLLIEIGHQPLSRPFAQKGWLLRVIPGINLLFHESVRTFYFQHDADISNKIGEMFDGGKALLPPDEICDFFAGHAEEKNTTKAAFEFYLSKVPPPGREEYRDRVISLFDGYHEII